MNEEALQSPVSLAAAAQREWARAGMTRRLAVLREVGAALIARADDLHACLERDGLSRRMARYYGAWILQQARPDRLEAYARGHVQWCPTAERGELLIRRPDGVVLLITPSNSPTINGASFLSMLLPGNAVLVRAPEGDAGLRLYVDEITRPTLVRHGFSADVVQVITGSTRSVLDQTLDRRDLSSVVFFGNSTAGRDVARRCHERGKKAVLELEGSDFMIVFDDADLEAALESALHVFDFSSQPCLIPKHFLVHEAVHERFLRGLLARVPGCSTTVEADPESGTLVPVGRPELFLEALAEVRALGEVQTGGHRMRADGEPDERGRYVAPTVVTLEAAAISGARLRCFDDEISYPLAPIVRFAGSDDSICAQMCALLRESPFGLRASVWSESPRILEAFTRELGDVGLLLFNDEHSRAPLFASPWGGRKRSGGPYGESHFFWQKTSHLQAIGCNTLSDRAIGAVLDGLGARGLVDLELDASAPTPAPEVTAPVASSAGVERVRVRRDDGALHIELHRPERHNAFDDAMRAQLDALTADLHRDSTLRCVVVRGAGRSFCSGADLTMLGGMTPTEARQFMLSASWSFRRLERLPVPIVAAVRGYCFGGGFELALHCDEILASEDAVFCFPETKLGLITTTGAAQRLAAAIGTTRARAALLSARRIDAAEARALGFVSEVVPRGDLDEAVARYTRQFTDRPMEGVRAAKAVMRELQAGPLAHAFLTELEAFDGLVAARSPAERRG
ncbi:MAG: aldehyde dehydrogenase family protein [Nannocystaceae bacterium]